MFWSGPENLHFLEGRLPLLEYSAPRKLVGKNLTSSVSLTYDAQFGWGFDS